jgi:hypothetical protein
MATLVTVSVDSVTTTGSHFLMNEFPLLMEDMLLETRCRIIF